MARKQLTEYDDVQNRDLAKVQGVLLYGRYLTEKRPAPKNYPNIPERYEVTVGNPKIVGIKRGDGSTPTGLVKFLNDREYQSKSKVFNDGKPEHPAISIEMKGKFNPTVYGVVNTAKNRSGVEAKKLLAQKDSNGKVIKNEDGKVQYDSLESGQPVTALVNVFGYGPNGQNKSASLDGVVIKDVEHPKLFQSSPLNMFHIKRTPANEAKAESNNDSKSNNTKPTSNPFSDKDNNSEKDTDNKKEDSSSKKSSSNPFE